MTVITKQILAASLKKLMNRKSIEKITVKDLVDDCKLNRQTFYYHFQDIYDLLGWTLKQDTIHFSAENMQSCTWQESLRAIFAYVSDNRAFCENAYHSVGRDCFVDLLFCNAYERFIYNTEQGAAELGVTLDAQDKAFIGNYLTHGYIGVLLSWMSDGLQDDSEEVVDRLIRFMDNLLPHVLDKFKVQ